MPWPEILETNVAKEPNTGCWIWLGARMNTGYAGYRTTSKNNLVHRLAYEELIGPIPTGHHLHHICETRICVNPWHLKPLAPGDHLRKTLDLHGRDYLWKNRQRYQSHCGKGHLMEGENVYWTQSGKRYCKACIKIGNDRRPRKNAAVPSISDVQPALV